MRKKKAITQPPQSDMCFTNLTDEELLRVRDPVTRLECELYARLSNCLTERDEVQVELTKELELAHDDLDNTRTAMTDSEKCYINVRDALDSLKLAAKRVIDHWEKSNLSDAVNELRLVLERL